MAPHEVQPPEQAEAENTFLAQYTKKTKKSYKFFLVIWRIHCQTYNVNYLDATPFHAIQLISKYRDRPGLNGRTISANLLSGKFFLLTE